MRNVTATINKGDTAIKNNWRLDLSMNEMQVFFDHFNDTAEKSHISNAIWETVAGAYKMGLAVGMRNAKKRGA